jgi:hypothetical protein
MDEAFTPKRRELGTPAQVEMTVFRTGTFSVAAPEVEGKCGVFGKSAFRYDVWFTATAADLDARGFIVDNADLHRYFQRKYGEEGTPFVSCEVMGIKAIADFREAWPSAREIKVRVWGMEDVTYVESKWKYQLQI